MKTIVFFAYSIAPRSHKRIKSFIDAGYNVEVYTFSSPNTKTLRNINYPVITFGSQKHLGYLERLIKMIPWMHSGLKKAKRKDSIVYFFSLNTAWAAIGKRHLNYVYEESDMLFDRFKNPVFRCLTRNINLHVIKNSALTVFTSEGFSEFYYGGNTPNNVVFVPNKLMRDIENLPPIEKSERDTHQSLRFAFVGWIRYETIYLFAKYVKKNYPQHEFHFYGDAKLMDGERISELKDLGCVFHGSFSNPVDLPAIYSNVDVVVSTYDIRGLNPQYAEPNKIYESIYFRKPIVVSDNSFLADKVRKLNIGVAVDALKEDSVVEGIKHLMNSYSSFVESLNQIPQSDALDDNHKLLDRINQI